MNAVSWRAVIPSARSGNLVKAAGSVLAKHPGAPANCLIVVDDGAREGAERRLSPGVTWVQGVKPFVFARNVNLGLVAAFAAGAEFAVIMGDDVQVLSPWGAFDRMVARMTETPGLGLLSAAIIGVCGNENQNYIPGIPGAREFRHEGSFLCFVCVLLSKRAWEAVGPLDERFVGYGYDDNDYCRRLLAAGFKMGVLNEVVVDHHSIASTFRSRHDHDAQFAQNRALYVEKWGSL